MEHSDKGLSKASVISSIYLSPEQYSQALGWGGGDFAWLLPPVLHSVGFQSPKAWDQVGPEPTALLRANSTKATGWDDQGQPGDTATSCLNKSPKPSACLVTSPNADQGGQEVRTVTKGSLPASSPSDKSTKAILSLPIRVKAVF